MDTNSATRVLLCFLVAAGTLALSQTSSSRTVRHHREPVSDPSQPPELEQAEAAIEKKDYVSAESLLQKAVTTKPDSYQAWFDLGFVESSLDKSDDAIAAYRKSVQAKPDVFESNLNLGLMLAKSGQADAEQYLRAATRLRPQGNADESHARAWLGLARFFEGKNPEQALEAYRQAADLRPKDPEPRLAAGLLLEKENKFADAQQQYKEALAIDPSSEDALIGLANVSMKGRRFGEAEEYLRKIVSQRPNEAASHIQLGRVLAADQKYEDAIAELQMGVKIAPQDASAQRDLADVLLDAGKFSEAEALYRSLLKNHEKDPELHAKLGQTLLKSKNFPAAEQEFLNTVQLKPDMGGAYGDLAIAANEAQHYPLAIKALDARAKYLPEIPVTYFLRATAYDHLRDYHQAAANYHLFLQVANGKYPDQEWQARHRLITIEPKK